MFSCINVQFINATVKWELIKFEIYGYPQIVTQFCYTFPPLNRVNRKKFNGVNHITASPNVCVPHRYVHLIPLTYLRVHSSTSWRIWYFERTHETKGLLPHCIAGSHILPGSRWTRYLHRQIFACCSSNYSHSLLALLYVFLVFYLVMCLCVGCHI